MRKAFLLAALVAAGCGGAAKDGTGDIAARVDGITATSGVTRVAVSVSPANVSQDLTYNASDGSFSGTLVVPVGVQTLTATAYASAVVVGTGTATVTVTANATAAASITILDTSGRSPSGDHGPFVTSLTATKTSFTAGEAVTLTATAVDPDGDALTYAWTQTCSTGVTGTFGSAAAATTTWSASASGSCTLRLTAASRALSDSRTIDLLIFPATGTGSGGIQVTGTYVPQPRISGIYVSASGAPPDIIYRTDGNADYPYAVYPNQSLFLEAAYDTLPQGAMYAVEVSDNCGGAGSTSNVTSGFTDGTWRAPGTPQVCLVMVKLTRDGLVDTFAIAVNVSGCIDDDYEHNDSPSAARNVWSSTFQNLYAHDDDWYYVNTNGSPSTLAVTLTTTDAIPVEIVAPDGATVLAAGSNAVSHAVAASTRYYVHVKRGAAAATCGSKYDLSISY